MSQGEAACGMDADDLGFAFSSSFLEEALGELPGVAPEQVKTMLDHEAELESRAGGFKMGWKRRRHSMASSVSLLQRLTHPAQGGQCNWLAGHGHSPSSSGRDASDRPNLSAP